MLPLTRSATALFDVLVSSWRSLALAFLLAGSGFAVGAVSLPLGVGLAGLGGLFLLPMMDRYCQALFELRPAALWLLRVMLLASLVLNLGVLFGLIPGDFALPTGSGELFETVGLMGWSVGGSIALSLALIRPRGRRL